LPRTRTLIQVAVAMAAVALLALAGGAAGVGPLAATMPPEKVTDPKEMVARSLQATLYANAVHLDGTLTGTIPGSLVEHPEAAVALDGSTISIDIRPKDAKTKAHIESPGLALSLDTVTVWNDAWYRFAAATAWTKTTAGDASAKAGVDINPLTFVDRLRSFLDAPDIVATASEVACASASGRCHEIRLDAGTDPARILASVLPDGRGANLPSIPVTVTLDTDALTLRPAHLVIEGRSADGAVVLMLVLDASRWDGEVVIDQPAG
jgi:hypothetical protein